MADENDDEIVDVTVRLPKRWLEDELMGRFETATSRPEAIRMALERYVDSEDELVVGAEVHNRVIEAMEEQGGRVETSLNIQLGDVDNVNIDNAEAVTVSNAEE
jgi:metal-responsive CopG/Arc/MetJ family transcriptional regulator